MASSKPITREDVLSGDWIETQREFAATWDFQNDGVLIGEYARNKTIPLPNPQTGEMEDRLLFEFEKVQGRAEDKSFGVWGDKNVSEGMAPIAIGSLVRIEFVGKVDGLSGGKSVNEYRISYRKP